MRAKLIYEKFTQDSDPISDLRIGLKEKLKSFTIKNHNHNIFWTKDEVKYLEKIFGYNYENDLYFVYDSEDITYNYSQKYFKYLKRLIHKKAFKRKEIHGFLYDTYKMNNRKLLRVHLFSMEYWLAEFDIAAKLYLKFTE